MKPLLVLEPNTGAEQPIFVDKQSFESYTPNCHNTLGGNVRRGGCTVGEARHDRVWCQRSFVASRSSLPFSIQLPVASARQQLREQTLLYEKLLILSVLLPREDSTFLMLAAFGSRSYLPLPAPTLL